MLGHDLPEVTQHLLGNLQFLGDIPRIAIVHLFEQPVMERVYQRECRLASGPMFLATACHVLA